MADFCENSCEVKSNERKDSGIIPENFSQLSSLLVPKELATQIRDERHKRLLAQEQAKAEAEAEKENAKAEPVVKEVLPKESCLRVFEPEKVKAALQKRQSRSEKGADLESQIAIFMRHGGYRRLPQFKKPDINHFRQAMELEQPNFQEVTNHLADEFLLSSIGKKENFFIKPIVLVGPPGVGKTYYASSVADFIGVDFHKIAASELQSSLDLVGTGSRPSSVGVMSFMLMRRLSPSLSISLEICLAGSFRP